MMKAALEYVAEVSRRWGAGWNRFWFTPVDPVGLCGLRIGVGLLSLAYLLSFTGNLTDWFGSDGLLPLSLVQAVTRDVDGAWNGRASYLYFVTDDAGLQLAHALGILIALAFTVGLATRVSNILLLLVALSYVHRAPMVQGLFEPVWTMLLCYLCLAPCGRCLSVDAWWRCRRKGNGHAALKPGTSSPSGAIPSVAAGIALRLIQVHLAAFYIMMGLTKLGGSLTWWTGEAMWWLIAHSESRLVDWTWLAGHEYLLNFWTQGVVLLELAYGLLIWHRLARPVLIAGSTLHWLLLAVVTGQVSWAAAMICANAVFVAPEVWVACCGSCCARGEPAGVGMAK